MLKEIRIQKKMLYVFGICIIFLMSWNIPTTMESNLLQEVYKGTATYYNNKFQGVKTASGEKYDKNEYTAAVRMNEINVSFGTIIEVTNVQNKKKIQVRVNDKMNNRSSNIIDLSYKAAAEIGVVRAGIAKVEVRVISK